MKKYFGLSQWKNLATYWVCFAVVFIYWELLIKIVTGGLIGNGGYFFLCFVPAEAMFFTFLEGWLEEELLNRFFMPIFMMLLASYYAIQVGYYRVFGSLISVSMLQLGADAVEDFGWTTKSILISSTGIFIMVFLPVLISIVIECTTFMPKKRYSIPLHLYSLLITGALWILGVAMLLLGGTSRQSAYYAFSNSLMDTDTTSQKIGASVTTLIETGSYMLGLGGSADTDVALAPPMVTPAGKPGISFAEEGSSEAGPASSETKEPGVHVLEEIDFLDLKTQTKNATIQNLCDYYAQMEGTKENEYTGMFEGYNLIYICAESFWTYAVDKTVTPTLYEMTHNGIILDNYYNSFKNTTTNGEFAFVTSLWPDVSRNAAKGSSAGSFPQSAKKYMPYGLGNITEDLGYQAYGYHNYEGTYYGRNKSLANLGLQCKFMNAGMTFTTSWPASDLEMMEQSVDDYIEDDLFVAYYMTFSGHGPYDRTSNKMTARNWEEVTNLTEGWGFSDAAAAYLSCQKELDKALEYLLERLEEAGKAENTLIVLTGDHYPYYLTDAASKSLVGAKLDADFEAYKSTCILYNAGMKTPIHNAAYCCNVDILPTVLNLLNIPYDSRMLAGKDVFSDGLHKAVLYNKSYITDVVKYNAATGKKEWLIDVSNYSSRELTHYAETISDQIEAEYAASLNMMSCDFYKFVWENSGLLWPEE